MALGHANLSLYSQTKNDHAVGDRIYDLWNAGPMRHEMSYGHIRLLLKGNGNKNLIVSFERDSKTIYRSLLQHFCICFTSEDILT